MKADYETKKNELEIKKTDKSSDTPGETCTNTFVLIDCPTQAQELFLTVAITEWLKALWRFISKLRLDSHGIRDLNIAGSITNDDTHKTEALNNHLKSVFTNDVNSKLPNIL